MLELRKSARATLLAICLSAIAGCAPEGDPVGVSTLPTDPGARVLAGDMTLDGPATRQCTEHTDTGGTCDGHCQTEES